MNCRREGTKQRTKLVDHGGFIGDDLGGRSRNASAKNDQTCKCHSVRTHVTSAQKLRDDHPVVHSYLDHLIEHDRHGYEPAMQHCAITEQQALSPLRLA